MFNKNIKKKIKKKGISIKYSHVKSIKDIVIIDEKISDKIE